MVTALTLGVLLSLLTVKVQAEWLFYQPQDRDAAVNEQQWRQMWRQAADDGYHTLLVQWTRHGESTFGGESGWLRSALRQAQEAGLALVLGLYYDPGYYEVLARERDSTYYWHHLLGQSRLQQQALMDWGLEPAGWYLPYELDDTLIATGELLAEIRTQFAEVSRQLSAFTGLHDLPVHISAFTSGRLSPGVYAEWLQSISDAGLQVWWQNGRGTGLLPPIARQAYEQALPCDTGIVNEAFMQTSQAGEPFVAGPVPDFQRPRSASGCHPQAVFSLRYLPFAASVLESTSEPEAGGS
jgi:hypothetical protein